MPYYIVDVTDNTLADLYMEGAGSRKNEFESWKMAADLARYLKEGGYKGNLVVQNFLPGTKGVVKV